jgi:membrane protease YdiL (CAAX protease family)
VSAALLYALFYVGNVAIRTFPVGGLWAGDEASIYSLIVSPSNPLPVQVAVLLFDSLGYESFFRGVLQKRLQSRIGVGAAPTVALLDALLHLATLNPLWVATTFVADLGWGLTFYFGRGLPASLTNHFVWDVAIFLARPIV